MKKFNTYTDQKSFWDDVCNYLPTKSQEFFRLAVSGGSSANIINELKERDFDFKNTDLFQVDERDVPRDHPESNFKTITEKLGDTIPHFFSSFYDKNYEGKLIEDEDGNIFDCVILGVGPDGHVASIFPESIEKILGKSLIAHTTTENFEPRNRLTLTFSAIKKSKRILVLLIGEKKKDIWEKIQNSEERLPVHFISEMKQSHFFWVR